MPRQGGSSAQWSRPATRANGTVAAPLQAQSSHSLNAQEVPRKATRNARKVVHTATQGQGGGRRGGYRHPLWLDGITPRHCLPKNPRALCAGCVSLTERRTPG